MPAWLVPLSALSCRRVLGVHYISFCPSRAISLGVLVLQGVAGTQKLVVSATRMFEQLSLMNFLINLLICCSCLFLALF